MKDELQEQLLQSSFHSDQYNVSGRWVEDENGLAIEFVYNGKTVIIPFPVYVSEQTMSVATWERPCTASNTPSKAFWEYNECVF